ncbi:hypothetical protein C2845_PM10G12790 [Panicum miliaceum]|uniref:Uncharacterized protein n=1 Tax=Panicum miliaceum TaxID=4540 RepID=A0A3L6PC84_PANMI|nr:hypothetical protein C2845_PM10G12790 [Panicum miliaceum]
MARSSVSGAAVVALVVLAFLVAASSGSMCCREHRPWGNSNEMGCSPDQNGACNSWCQAWCRGGECKLRGGHHQCHCYC